MSIPENDAQHEEDKATTIGLILAQWIINEELELLEDVLEAELATKHGPHLLDLQGD